jgi:hypothetical protein
METREEGQFPGAVSASFDLLSSGLPVSSLVFLTSSFNLPASNFQFPISGGAGVGILLLPRPSNLSVEKDAANCAQKVTFWKRVAPAARPERRKAGNALNPQGDPDLQTHKLFGISYAAL